MTWSILAGYSFAETKKFKTMSKGKSTMTSKTASRLQSIAGRIPGSKTAVTGFYQRAQVVSAGNKGGLPSTTGKPSGGGRDNYPPQK